MGRTKSCCGVYEWCRDLTEWSDSTKNLFLSNRGFCMKFLHRLHILCILTQLPSVQRTSHHEHRQKWDIDGIKRMFLPISFCILWCFGGGRPLQQFVCRGAMLMFMMPVDVTQCTRFWEGACWVHVAPQDMVSGWHKRNNFGGVLKFLSGVYMCEILRTNENKPAFYFLNVCNLHTFNIKRVQIAHV